MELSQFEELFDELTTLLCVYAARNGEDDHGNLKYEKLKLVAILLCWQHCSLSVADIKHSCYRICHLRALLPASHILYISI